MAQNIYDQPTFFAAYSTLPRSSSGLSAAPEWPLLRSLIGPVKDKRILDLGAGFGYFVKWARDEGARSVLGVDLSENMLTAARELVEVDDGNKREGKVERNVMFERADLDEVVLGKEEFDVVFSSLTLHYLTDLDRLLGEVWKSLVPGGKFVFSVEHPIFTAPTHPGFQPFQLPNPSSASSDKQETLIWPLNAYHKEGLRTTDWLAKGVRKQHRTLSAYFTAILESGFEIRAVREWTPSVADLEEHPEWRAEVERPMFLLVGVEKSVKKRDS